MSLQTCYQLKVIHTQEKPIKIHSQMCYICSNLLASFWQLLVNMKFFTQTSVLSKKNRTKYKSKSYIWMGILYTHSHNVYICLGYLKCHLWPRVVNNSYFKWQVFKFRLEFMIFRLACF